MLPDELFLFVTGLEGLRDFPDLTSETHDDILMKSCWSGTRHLIR